MGHFWNLRTLWRSLFDPVSWLLLKSPPQRHAPSTKGLLWADSASPSPTRDQPSSFAGNYRVQKLPSVHTDSTVCLSICAQSANAAHSSAQPKRSHSLSLSFFLCFANFNSFVFLSFFCDYFLAWKKWRPFSPMSWGYTPRLIKSLFSSPRCLSTNFLYKIMTKSQYVTFDKTWASSALKNAHSLQVRPSTYHHPSDFESQKRPLEGHSCHDSWFRGVSRHSRANWNGANRCRSSGNGPNPDLKRSYLSDAVSSWPLRFRLFYVLMPGLGATSIYLKLMSIGAH